jgi:hypothetical protein
MNEVIRGYWAVALFNNDFIFVETYSGYRGGTDADPKGKAIFLAPDVNDETLGVAVLDAMTHSRFVLYAPREGSTYPPEIEFDTEIGVYKLSAERYLQWVKDVMARYRYKTRRKLFQDMKNCSIERKSGVITIMPSEHQKLEQWGRDTVDQFENVVIPDNSTAAEIGAALRLAFSRCTV